MQEAIKVERLSKAFGSLQALDDISFSVARGTIFGLLGANGAGKTTAIECMLGTKTPDSGTVSILGMNPKKDRKKLFEHIGVQFQETHYQDKITVAELCDCTASFYRQAEDPHQLLAEFGLAEKRKSPVSELSGGQKQRLFLVLALLPKPQAVFLDELTTGLDAKVRRTVWNMLTERKKQGLTLFLTSHFMDEVETLCDQICILKHGKSVFSGTVSEALRSSPCQTFEDAYLWYTDEEGQTDETI